MLISVGFSVLIRFCLQEPYADYQVELKIYQTDDVKGLDNSERWKHAITILKIAYDKHTPIYRHLEGLKEQALTQAEAHGAQLAKKSKRY